MEKYILTNIIISENKVTINSLLTFEHFRGFGRGEVTFKPKKNNALLPGTGNGTVQQLTRGSIKKYVDKPLSRASLEGGFVALM